MVKIIKKKKPDNGPITKKGVTKWKDEYWIRIYQMAVTGLTREDIAKSLGIELMTLKKWLKKRPALKQALQEVKEGDNGIAPFKNYVYQRLPVHLKEVWDEIHVLEKEENGTALIEALFERKGYRTRQHLFLHALMCCNFNSTRACKKVGISENQVREWIERDWEFAEIVEQVRWHRGNFFEEALFKLVKKLDPSATIFANKTFNRDRGYNDKTTVDIHDNRSESVVDLDAMDLPLETRKELLKAIRKSKEGKKEGENQEKEKENFIPVEAKVLESKPNLVEKGTKSAKSE